MLTDRQQMFYLKIAKMIVSDRMMTEQEKKYLERARQSIEMGKDFKKTVNSLNLALKALDYGRIQAGGLTPSVKQLFEELKEIYGEPVYKDIYAENLAGIGGGRVDWRLRDFLFGGAVILPIILIIYKISPMIHDGLYRIPLIAGWLFIIMISLIIHDYIKNKKF